MSIAMCLRSSSEMSAGMIWSVVAAGSKDQKPNPVLAQKEHERKGKVYRSSLVGLCQLQQTLRCCWQHTLNCQGLCAFPNWQSMFPAVSTLSNECFHIWVGKIVPVACRIELSYIFIRYAGGDTLFSTCLFIYFNCIYFNFNFLLV